MHPSVFICLVFVVRVGLNQVVITSVSRSHQRTACVDRSDGVIPLERLQIKHGVAMTVCFQPFCVCFSSVLVVVLFSTLRVRRSLMSLHQLLHAVVAPQPRSYGRLPSYDAIEICLLGSTTESDNAACCDRCYRYGAWSVRLCVRTE